MGLFDSIKAKLSGSKPQIKKGIDTAADKIDDKLPQHADKIQQGAAAAKDAVDKLPE